jgi:hypothetical protein
VKCDACHPQQATTADVLSWQIKDWKNKFADLKSLDVAQMKTEIRSQNQQSANVCNSGMGYDTGNFGVEDSE